MDEETKKEIGKIKEMLKEKLDGITILLKEIANNTGSYI